ncbi:hypothetical protein HDV03_004966 [Kappamyces sp. JEL0829]|nr:hypothetical protein HDV03_004966 [Kappamyces sp. JEL0829]
MSGLTAAGSRRATIDYTTLVESLYFTNIVFESPSPLQSWSTVRDAIALCSASLKRLSLEISDETFLEFPADYVYFPTKLELSGLTHIKVSSKSQKAPQKLILELLRAAPIGGLKSLRLNRCLSNFDASGWFLIRERGGGELEDLVLTPSVGPNMLGWEERYFHDGLDKIATSCTQLSRVNISGHSCSISQSALEKLTRLATIRQFYFPCSLTDAHLLVLMSSQWRQLEILGMNCMCIDGEHKEKQKEGLSCNRFTDQVMTEFLNALSDNATNYISIFLPTYLISLKTGKRIDTLQWLSCNMHVTSREGARFWYKEVLILSVPASRLANYL